MCPLTKPPTTTALTRQTFQNPGAPALDMAKTSATARTRRTSTCCCIGQLPVDDQCILSGMRYLPMQLGALFYRIYLPHLQHNVQVRREEGGSATSHPGYLCLPRHCRWTWSKAGYGLQQVSTIPPRRNLSNYTTTLPTSMQSLRQFGAPVTAAFLRICT